MVLPPTLLSRTEARARGHSSQVYRGACHFLYPTPLCRCLSAKEAFQWQGHQAPQLLSKRTAGEPRLVSE